MTTTTVTLPDGITIVSEAEAPKVVGKARRRGARVTAVVGAPDLNIADQAAPWDPTVAQQNVAAWASSDGSGSPETVDWQKYASAFFFANGDEAGPSFDAFLLPFADVIDGELQAIPAGITEASATVNSGTVDGASPEDMTALAERIAAYETAMAEKFGTGAPAEPPADQAPAQAAPMDEMETAGDMAEQVGGGEDEAAGLEERVAALAERVAAIEAMMGAQVQAQVAAIIDGEAPLPALS